MTGGRPPKWQTLATAGWPPVADDDRAACKSYDPDLFFSKTGRSAAEALAKRICQGCPVLEECKAWAMPVSDLHGVWAATTAYERKRWRKNKEKEA